MTLLIKNVQIVGGDRDFPEGTCLFINDDKISAIGNFGNKKADVIVDGQGAYLSPGFIDVNTDSDHYLTLFNHPSQEDFIKQGVTTIFGGMCGSSLAPLLYGSLESLNKWGDTDRVNVNWHTMEEFLKVMDSRPLAVNFGTLVGHSTIRRAILGKSLRDLTKNEIGVFSQTLRIALQQGAFGMSTGLGYVHAHKTPYSELRTFAEIVHLRNGVYTTHLRNIGAGMRASVAETIKLVRETGVRALISHFLPVVGEEQEYEEAFAMIEALPASVDLHFDIHPSPYSLLPLYTFLPDWAQNGGIEVMRANINDEWLCERIKKDMPRINEDDFVVAQAPGNDFFVGKSLHDIKEMYELSDSRDALLRLMVAMKMKGGILYKNLNTELISKAIKSNRSFIASNAPSFDLAERTKRLKSDSTISTFPTFLAMAEEQKFLSFGDAIKKITLTPARKFELANRGLIKEGNVADLVCLKGNDIKFTVVSGKVVERNGTFQNNFSGKTLRHGKNR